MPRRITAASKKVYDIITLDFTHCKFRIPSTAVNSIHISWTKPKLVNADLLSYVAVCRLTSAPEADVQIKRLGPNVVSWQFEGLSRDVEYNVFVKAEISGGEVVDSPAIVCKVARPPSKVSVKVKEQASELAVIQEAAILAFAHEREVVLRTLVDVCHDDRDRKTAHVDLASTVTKLREIEKKLVRECKV